MEKKSYKNTNTNNSQPNKIRGGETNIMKNMKKVVSVLSTTALAASLVVPFAGVASAATDSRVSEVPNFTNDKQDAKLATLTFQEDSEYPSDLQEGKDIVLTFPSGAKVDTVTANVYDASGAVVGTTNVDPKGDYTVNITLPSSLSGKEKLVIDSKVDLDDFEASTVDVKVESLGAGVPSGTYTLARVSQGDSTATVLSTKTIGEDGGQIGTLRIEESAIGSLEGTVNVKLPKGYTWDVATDGSKTTVSGLGGLTVGAVTGDDDRVLEIPVTSNNANRGFIQVEAYVNVKDDAKYGDIELGIYGDASEEDIVVGTYSDYEVTIEADGDPEELISGGAAAELQKLVIKNDVSDSITPNRKTTVTLPSAVKIKKVTSSANVTVTGDTYENEFTFKTDGDLTKDIELTIEAWVDADFTGDIEAELDGRAGIEGKALLATAKAPISITAESKNVTIGLKDQAVGNIVLTEAEDGILSDNDEVTLTLTEDVKWSEEPKVEVTEGDLEIDEDSVKVDGKELSFKVKDASTELSVITISNAKIDVDRTVAEGDIKVTVDGDFINADNATATEVEDMGKFQIANVVTGSYTDASFVIGSTTYTVNGEEKAMDVAPFIQDGRTLLPVRYVAEAFGLNDDNIIWNQAAKTVTIMKGDRVAQLTIGSDVLTVNGVQVPMDVKAQVVDGRTVLPVRYVAQALGAQIDYNDVTKTITVK